MTSYIVSKEFPDRRIVVEAGYASPAISVGVEDFIKGVWVLDMGAGMCLELANLEDFITALRKEAKSTNEN